MPDDKWQREIEEILEKQDRKEPARVMTPGRRPASPRNFGRGFVIRPEHLLFGGLLFLVFAVVIRTWALPLAITGAVLLAGGYLLSFRRSRRARPSIYSPNAEPTPYWRGQPVSRRSSPTVVRFREPWTRRVKRWFTGKRG